MYLSCSQLGSESTSQIVPDHAAFDCQAKGDSCSLTRFLKTASTISELEDSSASIDLLASATSTDLSNPLASVPISFPHPTESLNEQLDRHTKLWKQMGQGFHGFIQNLAVWEQAKEEERTQTLSLIDKIPEEAAKRFEAQYFELARKYPDFAIWANLQEHKTTKGLIGELSESVRLYATLSKAAETSIDIGFMKLHDGIKRSVLATLPIEALADLRWLADETGQPDLSAAVTLVHGNQDQDE